LAIKYGKSNIHLNIQWSIDGHKPITDKNRGQNMTEKILDTLYKL
jgi:sulfatase maturation enzyme AslB (radical SAM superfamily)